MRIHSLLFICVFAVSGSVLAQSAVEQAQARSAAKAAAAKAAEDKAAAEKAAADKAAADKAAAEKAAQAAPAAPAAKVYRDGVIKVGDEMKETRGRVTDVDRGDNGCYLTFRNEKNSEMIELGKFELCTQKPSFKGKQVEFEYRMETVQAASCYGDPKCKKTETVPLIVSVKVLD